MNTLKNKVWLSFLVILVFACGKKQESLTPEIEKGLLQNQTIRILGNEREYHLYIPENPTNAPLVILFHGNGGDFDAMLGLTGVKAPYKVWLNLAQLQNLIIAVPNGNLGSNNSRGWNDCRSDNQTNPTSDDVLFVSELIDFISTKYQSDNTKVFAVGTSNGGIFVQRLADEIPHKITAFASIISARPINSVCSNSTTKVSALFMNGTKDDIVPYAGGQVANNRGEVLSIESTVEYWIIRNGTETTPEVSDMSNINITDNSTITKFLYKNGENNTQVLFYKVINGGHTEPSITERYSTFFLQLVGNQNGDVEMANEVWNFFKDK
ncbi:MAG: alpha/beta hydrolase family esterase [Bernardetiaceae bacterium]